MTASPHTTADAHAVRAAAERSARAGRAVGWSGRRRGGVIGNWFFISMVRLLGLRAAYGLLAGVACYYLLFAPKARRASRSTSARRWPAAGAW